MSTVSVKQKIKKERNFNYLTKNFDNFRNELLTYARTYFPENINDFSETSVGGMLLDFSSIVGDTMSYYMDHQFNEIDPDSAVETDNIIRHIKRAGIKSSPASPSSVAVSFYIELDVESFDVSSNPVPNSTHLPTFRKGTSVISNNGIVFTLVEDLNFSNDYTFESVSERNATTELPEKIVISKKGVCISGNEENESFNMGAYIPFKRVNLTQPDVSEIISITDSEGNEYYEVEDLTQDTVYKNENGSIETIIAPYRFMREDNFNAGTTTVIFGSGNAEAFDSDFLEDPSSASISLFGKSYFSNKSIDPKRILQTSSHGISPTNTIINVKYKYGGGISHNVGASTIRNINTLNVTFNTELESLAIRDQIISSVGVENLESASGGSARYSLQELRDLIPYAQYMQSRVVNIEDLLARLYTFPTEFGRIYRAAAHPSENFNNTTDIFMLTRTNNNFLSYASDGLKENLKKYLENFRLAGTNYNLLDSPIINFSIKLKIKIGANRNIDEVTFDLLNRILNIMKFQSYQIDQPVNVSEIINITLNTEGVVSIISRIDDIIKIKSGEEQEEFENAPRQYSDIYLNVDDYLDGGLIFPLRGGIFELKYPTFDIVIDVV